MKKIIIEHQTTGEKLTFYDAKEKSVQQFRRSCRALDVMKEKGVGLAAYFITLTLTDDNAGASNKEITRFCNWVRISLARAGSPCGYVWCVELQKKRYRTHGVMALHWHIVVVTTYGALPDLDYRDKKNHRGLYVKTEGTIITAHRLRQVWGLGRTFCQVVKSPTVFGYLGKYLEKDYGAEDGYRPEWGALRRWGSSNLGKDKWPMWAQEKHAEVIARLPEFDGLYWRKMGSSIVAGAKDTLTGKFRPVVKFKSPWRLVWTEGGAG